MGLYTKNIKIVDLNLFSGSTDRFRTTVGGYWTTEETDYGEEIAMEDYPADDTTPSWNYFAKIEKEASVEASSETILSTQKFPVRVYGNDAVASEEFWKVYWTGGTFGDDTYEGVYSEDVFDDYWFKDSLPYSKLEVANLVGGSIVEDEIEISSNYSFYLKDYQTYAANTSELLIPNMYLIEMFNQSLHMDWDTTTLENKELSEEQSGIYRLYDNNIRSFVDLEGTLQDFMDASTRELPAKGLTGDISTYLVNLEAQITGRGTGYMHAKEADHGGMDFYTLKLHRYLTGAVPSATLSASTTAYVENALENLMFDQNSISNDYLKNTFVDIENDRFAFPYYIKFKFPSRGRKTPKDAGSEFSTDEGDSAYFTEAIQDNNFDCKFLKSLKEAFSFEINEAIPTVEEYVMSKNFYEPNEDYDDADTKTETAENTSFTTVDFFDLWTYSYENYNSLTDNCFFVGERTITREAAMDTTGTYRYINSKNALGALGDIVSFLRDKGSGTTKIYNDGMSVEKLFNGRTNGKYNEIIAYRIEKIGGEASGDYKSQNAIQNFWIFNSTNLGDGVNFYDSQVKYDEDYIYNVYKYVIVVGVKYAFSDLVLTKVTANTIVGEADGYCLQFYDPATGDVADSLYDTSEGTTTTSTYSNLADFNVTIEPAIKIFEIPMFSKKLKVLDNPPNQLNLNPFFLLDNSQTIGYKINYETFIKQGYPATISSADDALKVEYLNSRDMIDGDNVVLESRSQQRYVQVYRLSEMPTSFTSFDANLISTIDLKLANSVFTLSNTIMYDKINTNQKYYYLFRILNENLMPGQLSEIYEAELVNDGGYTYGMFDLLFESDLETDDFTNPSIVFKKLIQLQPNVSQVTLNDENVDYDGIASDELINMTLGATDDPIWDKTFKIRLTSKKTGRKIDLNVTYKYDIDSN